MPLQRQIIDVPLGGLEAKVDPKLVKPGELLANLYGRPYRPDPIDGAYGIGPSAPDHP